MQTYHREWGLGVYRPNESVDVAVHYGVRIVGEKATYNLTESGSWVQSSAGEIASTVKTGNEQQVKIEIDGIPCFAPDARVLDCGCGGGANIKRLLKKCPRGIVKGIDYSPVSVESRKRSTRPPSRRGAAPFCKAAWRI